MQIILGSQSPRRREILSHFTLPFLQVSSAFDEESVPFEGDPHIYVNKISKGKADVLSLSYPDQVILTADTIVFHEGKVYGKPKNDVEAFSVFKTLVGNWHHVYTSLTLRQKEKEFQIVEETKVLFNLLTDKQIRAFYKALPYHDKAGGYTIQEAGSLIVNKIDGAYDNVLGLPINSLCHLLKKVDIDLWDYLPDPLQNSI